MDSPSVNLPAQEARETVELNEVNKPNPPLTSIKAGHHVLINDKVLIRSAIVVAMLLCISWSFQWASIILPAWRGDQYHTGGLFQICGNTDFKFNATTSDIYPGEIYPWKCEPFDDYVDRFSSIFPNKNGDWYVQAQSSKRMIVVSRWFEITSTSMDMIFGITTIWAVVYPNTNRKKQEKNMQFALIGVLLTPAFTLVDTFIQNSYWEAIGVGHFEKGGIQSFLYTAGNMNWASTAMDFFLQIGFLGWGIRKQYRLFLEGNEAAKLGVV
ncbi:hypothetical protein HDU99_004297 [Rhizoclosmatium hyalinum]|nr:hypothetical protein HDU99_004297 [Rhizoclosmatium hyalinum]